ncbi:hypothetical protein [Fodinicola feengrottensis]|uniref:Glycerophosphoryl diester phosphodiesterase membrane domain-containing protein n=1 Tax=Fodinicola feengrottensis TaxID=435914 RepID=A0ABN2HDV1_9ACTN|nr:hypothetical protein [Fodinicola feengrottensis]
MVATADAAAAVTAANPAQASPGVAEADVRGVPSIPMRPLAVGEVIDYSWDMVRRWPRISLTLGALTTVAVQLVALPMAALVAVVAATVDTNGVAGTLALLLSIAGATFAVTALTYTGTAALSGMLSIVADDAVTGVEPSLRRVRRKMRGRWPALIGVSLVIGAIESIASLISSFLLLSIGWMAVQPLTSMAAPTTVLERLNPFRAIRRSAALSGRDSGRVILIRFLASVIQSVLTLVTGAIYGGGALLLLGFLGETTPVLLGLLFGAELVALVTGALIAPFVAFNSGVLYADRRMRGEGLDIEVLLANRRRRRGVAR